MTKNECRVTIGGRITTTQAYIICDIAKEQYYDTKSHEIMDMIEVGDGIVVVGTTKTGHLDILEDHLRKENIPFLSSLEAYQGEPKVVSLFDPGQGRDGDTDYPCDPDGTPYCTVVELKRITSLRELAARIADCDLILPDLVIVEDEKVDS